MNTQPKIELFKKLNKFVKRFYTNQLIKGGIYCIAVLTIFFIVFSIAEYFTKFDVGIRTFLFWTYLIINALIAFPVLNINDILFLSIITGVLSQVGDLLESWFKRKYQVKVYNCSSYQKSAS